MSPAKEIAVEVRDLSKRFGRFVAVDCVSFEVRRGEVFGFLGPNGAGKTTTIKILTGLVPPTSGSGRVVGFEIGRQSARIRESIGYMSQLFSLYGDLTVDENIALFAGLYGVPAARRRERRDWVLQMAGLAGQIGSLAGNLSLGVKQRLALGCAILHEPPVLFLDEPTSGVDPISRRKFWDLIYAMAERGTTVFVTTHYLEEAEYCNRLALMNRGRLIALGTPASLRSGLDRPLFRVATQRSVQAVDALTREDWVLETGLFGRDVHVTARDTVAGSDRVADALARAGVPFDAIEVVPPSLEDVFVSLIHAEGGAPDE